MRPKIGVCTKLLSCHRPKWYEFLDEIKYDVLEINLRNSLVFLQTCLIKDLIKTKTDRFNLSAHSSTKNIFEENEQFTKTEIETIKSEIIVCNMLNAKELTFHLKFKKLNDDEAKIMQEIIDFSKQHGVQLIFESGNKNHADITLDILERFPELEYNLDLGHINMSYGLGNFGMEIKDFIEKVKDRTTYIHAHNNNGKTDQHLPLSEGTLDWKAVLDQLDMNKVKKIIMEVNKPEHAEIIKKELDEYFESRNL